MKKLKINTPRLIIRSLKMSDLLEFHFYRSNPQVTKYQGSGVLTMAQAKMFIDEQVGKKFGQPGQWVQYGIENKQTEKIIGDCAIKLEQNDIRIAEIGITISHPEQQKGYAKETMLGILNFLFTINDFHRVKETVDVENIASIKLLESIGFKKEGHFVENIFFNGKWGSEYQYAMLRNEWESLYSKKLYL
ncbi:GCN5 family acetyltransferase [Aequorivita aquimaris]|uniref:GCN5 family acetyltransferase n=1 Tax=Aequorivita aquimaris TaxID=1548749 RepID=A0A137RIQ6_9FLAO|nr:GNAT family protein [Aequorivita aquimaris]KXO00066.1 GCN5 family acetyltransferase [Aequorivita aquimaris]